MSACVCASECIMKAAIDGEKSAAETSAPSKFHKQNVGMKAFLQTSGTAVYTGGTHLTSGLHVNTR